MKFETFIGYCPFHDCDMDVEVKFIKPRGNIRGLKAIDYNCTYKDECSEQLCPIFLENSNYYY